MVKYYAISEIQTSELVDKRFVLEEEYEALEVLFKASLMRIDGLNEACATLEARCGELEAAINAEPELPGDMPEAMQQTIRYAVEHDDMEMLTELLRIIVRQTKEGIKQRSQESALKS